MIEVLNLDKTKYSIAERSLAATGLAAAATGLVALKFINPTEASFLPPCLFHSLFGFYCPGCGGTRGMHQLLNGDALSALHFNALLIFVVPLMIYGLAALLLITVRGRGLPFPKLSVSALWLTLALLLTFAFLRNLPFYPFTILAP
jgi:hypothetical protein